MEPPNDPELERLLKVYEERGETRVRQDLSMGRYSARRRAAAEYYLWLCENGREATNSREDFLVATSAKNAAWVAAIAAVVANVIAIVAIVISFLAFRQTS